MILDEIETIQHLLTTGKSLARYGDGELKICMGKDAISQPASPELTRRLREILKAEQDKVLVGVPRLFPTMPEKKMGFWLKYRSNHYLKLFDHSLMYGSAFVTRPDSAPAIDNPHYYNLVKLLWKGKRVLLYQGAGRRFLKAKPDLFETAKSHQVLYGPQYDAFSEYHTIYNILDQAMRDFDLVVLSLGACATVLAYDLGQAGIQALDLGHLGMFYAHIHPKARGYNGEAYPKDGK